jgi:Uma2 family endonuclease
MTVALERAKQWTADEFIVTDQHSFGDAWRYELVDGQIIAHAAPAPDHGAIAAGLTLAIGRLLSGMRGGCRPEVGSAATPRSTQRNTARIPDVMVRCGEHPRVIFEIVSPSEIRDWRGGDLKRKHLQSVEGVEEIVELSQDDFAAHVYRRAADAWVFEALGGPEAVLRLDSLAIEMKLSEIYIFALVAPAEPAAQDQ